MAITRIHLLTVPLDILPEEDIEPTILELLTKNEPQHIVFFTLWDLLKARRNTAFRTAAENAALCLPLSKSLITAARLLALPVPIRRNSFTMIIRILDIIDSHYKSLYLLGGSEMSLADAERNVHSTFPKLRIVGRFNGYYHKTFEPNIITSIVKAHPSLVIIGNGIPNGINWVEQNRNVLPGSIFIYNRDIIDIFAKRKKRISDSVFYKGYEFFPQLLKNPFKILYLFRYLWFYVTVLFYKLFRS